MYRNVRYIVVFSRNKMKQFPKYSIDGELIPAGDVGKCLGDWWREDLMATRAVEENIKKAFSCMVALVCSNFLGDLSPLSSWSVVEVCVMPSCFMVVRTGLFLRSCRDNWNLSERDG